MVQCGTGGTGNLTAFTNVNIPETEGEKKVKYISAGLLNTALVLSDGSIWETGYNGSGELGNGTLVDSLNFIQGVTIDKELKEVLTVRKKYPEILHGSASTGWALNTAVILKNGDIYTTRRQSIFTNRRQFTNL